MDKLKFVDKTGRETIFNLGYGLDDDGYVFDFTSSTVKDSNGNTIENDTNKANSSVTINIDKNSGTSITYSVEMSYTLVVNGIEYVLYLAHTKIGSLDYYVYILHIDSRIENDKLKVSANFTSIGIENEDDIEESHNIKFSSSVEGAEDDYYSSIETVGSAISNTNTITTTNDSMDISNVIPSASNSYVVRPYSGYIIKTIQIDYGTGSLLISRKSIASKSTAQGTFIYNYGFESEMTGNNYMFNESNFISWRFDEVKGYVYLTIFGIYNTEVVITAVTESLVEFRFEADSVYELSNVHNIEDVTIDNIGFKLYVGQKPLDYLKNTQTGTNLSVESSVNSATNFVTGEYTYNGRVYYYISFVYIGMAKLFDEGVTLKTVETNYTYRMTGFKVINVNSALSANDCYTVNSNDSTVDSVIDANKQYKVIHITDVKKLYTKSTNDISKFNGNTFARVLVEQDITASINSSTEINIYSYFYKMNADGTIAQELLDPVANGTWFNGQTLSQIKLSYFATNRANAYTNATYRADEGIITREFYGNKYNIFYTEIEGYDLTMISYLGRKYYLSYTLSGSDYVVNVKDASGNNVTLHDSINIYFTKDAGSCYGTYEFEIYA
ncbi:MAG: hypothetical protein IJX17_01670, partial [Clostridia bacterium]|nr:hypothetical protein [Clostridia bacterium]